MQVLEMIIARGGRGMSRAGGGETRFLASLGMTKFTTRNDKAYNSE